MSEQSVKLNLMELTRGTVVTLKSAEPGERNLYIVISRVAMKDGYVFLFDEHVHRFNADGTYVGAEHFGDPYILTIEAFNRRVSLTGSKTVRRIMKSFLASGEMITAFPSNAEINKAYNAWKRKHRESRPTPCPQLDYKELATAFVEAYAEHRRRQQIALLERLGV